MIVNILFNCFDNDTNLLKDRHEILNMVLNLVAIVFLFTCGIVFGNGQSTVGENELFAFKQKMAAMEEKMAKQEIRISSLEDQLKIRDVEIKDLKEKVLDLKYKKWKRVLRT